MVYVMLGEGFEEAEAIVPVDLLRRAGVEVQLAGVSGHKVTSSHGVAVECDCTLKELDEEAMEMLILPGGLGGVESILNSERALGVIQRAGDRGAYIAAICAAPTILARLGMLDRRKAVCYPGMEDLMLSAVVQRGTPVVVDGHLVTAEAAGSSFAFGFKLVEILAGKDRAEEVRRGVHYHYRYG